MRQARERELDLHVVLREFDLAGAKGGVPLEPFKEGQVWLLGAWLWGKQGAGDRRLPWESWLNPRQWQWRGAWWRGELWKGSKDVGAFYDVTG